MKRTCIVAVTLTFLVMAAAQPVSADDGNEIEDTPCVTIHTDPPDAAVDIGCIIKILEDLPPHE